MDQSLRAVDHRIERGTILTLKGCSVVVVINSTTEMLLNLIFSTELNITGVENNVLQLVLLKSQELPTPPSSFSMVFLGVFLMS